MLSTVMTFNVRYGTAPDFVNHWRYRRTRVIRLLEKSSPDIIGLQEALPFQIDELRAALPHYDEFGVGRDKGDRSGEHVTLLFRSDRFRVVDGSTFWFSDTPHIAGSRHWGNRNARICTWAKLQEKSSGHVFFCFNMHLDHWSSHSRKRSVQLLSLRMKELSQDNPVVVTGDFNTGERNEILGFLQGRLPLTVSAGPCHNPVPLIDAFRCVNPQAKRVGTFNKYLGHQGGEKIDFVLVSNHWTVHDSQILRNKDGFLFPSDHFPVTATIELGRS